jgi:hypothetical protein
VRFPYVGLPTRHPVFPLGGARVRHRPIVPVHIIGPQLLPPLDACLDCASECPVEAIFHDANVPGPWVEFVQLNADRTATLKAAGGHITERQEPKIGPACRQPNGTGVSVPKW